MSHMNYREAKRILDHNICEESIVMALMMVTDDDKKMKLKRSWPSIWDELEVRRHTSDGLMPSEKH